MSAESVTARWPEQAAILEPVIARAKALWSDTTASEFSKVEAGFYLTLINAKYGGATWEDKAADIAAWIAVSFMSVNTLQRKAMGGEPVDDSTKHLHAIKYGQHDAMTLLVKQVTGVGPEWREDWSAAQKTVAVILEWTGSMLEPGPRVADPS